MSLKVFSGIPEVPAGHDEIAAVQTIDEIRLENDHLKEQVEYLADLARQLQRRVMELENVDEPWRDRCLRAEHKGEAYLDVIRDLRQQLTDARERRP